MKIKLQTTITFVLQYTVDREQYQGESKTFGNMLSIEEIIAREIQNVKELGSELLQDTVPTAIACVHIPDDPNKHFCKDQGLGTDDAGD